MSDYWPSENLQDYYSLCPSLCSVEQMIVISKRGNLQSNPVGPSANRAARAGVGEQCMSPPQQLEISKDLNEYAISRITNMIFEHRTRNAQASAQCQAASVLRVLMSISLTAWPLLPIIVNYAVIGGETSISTGR
jgi:hypothetical protein